MRTLRDFKGGRKLLPSGSKLQNLSEAVRELQNDPARRLGGKHRRIFAEAIGTITDKGPNGETYATGQTSPDERHWVQLSYIKGTAKVWDAIKLNPDKISKPNIVYATNLPDLANHSHSLPKGQAVWVWAWLDKSNPPKLHWFCSSGGIGGVIVRLSAATTFTPIGGSPITLGGGRYVGNVFTLPTTDATLSSNLADADFGSSGAQCLLYNIRESGTSNRKLVTTAGIMPQFFFGFPLKPYSDGTPVFAIDGIQGGC